MPKKKPNSKADLCGQSAGPRKEPTESIPEPMQSRHAEEMARLENACREGSIPAVVDALILCHKSRAPIPLWLVLVLIDLLDMLFKGKTLRTAGRTGTPVRRYKMKSIHYARYDCVKELEERRDEMLAFIASMSQAEKDERPEFSELAHQFTLDQRCAAVSEMFKLMNHPAKGRPDTIRYSYDEVLKWIKSGLETGMHIPSRDNRLRFEHVNFVKGK